MTRDGLCGHPSCSRASLTEATYMQTCPRNCYLCLPTISHVNQVVKGDQCDVSSLLEVGLRYSRHAEVSVICKRSVRMRR